MTKRLKVLISLSVPLLIAHSLEEYLTDFQGWSPAFTEGFQLISGNAILTFLIMMWISFTILAAMAINEHWRLYVAILPAVLFTFEMHHWVEFIIDPHYKGGDITAIAIPVFLYFYWKEWWINIKKS